MHNLMKLVIAIMSAGAHMFRVPYPSDLWTHLPRAVRRMLFTTRQVTVVPVTGGATARMLETLHFAKGIDPVADAFAATVRSDVYAMRDHHTMLFLVYIGVGATGTSTITVNSCDDITPTTRTAIQFRSRDILATDVQGAITLRAAAGYIPAAGSSKIILIEVDDADLIDGDAFVELTLVESVNSPVLGSVLAIMGDGRYKENVSATVLA